MNQHCQSIVQHKRLSLHSASLRFMLCLIPTMILGACSTVLLEVKGSPEALKSPPRIALIETVLGAPDLPVLPLLDAGMYKSKVRDIGGDIVATNNQKIGEFEQSVAQVLSKELGKQILYGAMLQALPAYQNLPASGLKPYPLTLDNDVVVQAVVSPGTANFFNFGSESHLRSFFNQTNPEIQQTMAKIAAGLEMDAVVVAVGTVVTTAVSAFGISGARMFELQIYVFDKTGKMVLHGRSTTEATSGDGDDIEHYTSQLNTFSREVNRLAPALTGKAAPQ